MKIFLLALVSASVALAVAGDFVVSDTREYREKILVHLQSFLNDVKAQIEGQKLVEFYQKVSDIQGRINNLDLESSGSKWREALGEIQIDLAQLYKATVIQGSGYAVEEIDEEEIEGDETLAQRLLKRFQARLTEALEKVKELIAKHKEIAQEFSEKVSDIATRIGELSKVTGRKLMGKVRELNSKIFALTKEVLVKIGIGSGYDVEEVDEEEIDGDETLAQRLLKRFQARLTDALEKVKELIAKHKEIAQEFSEKVSDIATRIGELSKVTGRKLMGKVRELNSKIFALTKEVLAKIGIGSGYVVEEVDEEEIDGDETLRQRILKRFQTRMTESLEKVKELITKHKEIAQEFSEKISEIATRIGELSKVTGRKMIEKVRELNSNIRALTKAVLAKIGIGNYQYTISDIKSAINAFRNFFTSTEGLKALRENAARAPPSPTGAFILRATDQALVELMEELFKGVAYYSPIEYDNELRQHVKEAAEWLVTDEGTSEFRLYIKELSTSHPLASRLKTVLVDAKDEAIRAVIVDIFTLRD